MQAGWRCTCLPTQMGHMRQASYLLNADAILRQIAAHLQHIGAGRKCSSRSSHLLHQHTIIRCQQALTCQHAYSDAGSTDLNVSYQSCRHLEAADQTCTNFRLGLTWAGWGATFSGGLPTPRGPNLFTGPGMLRTPYRQQSYHYMCSNV